MGDLRARRRMEFGESRPPSIMEGIGGREVRMERMDEVAADMDIERSWFVRSRCEAAFLPRLWPDSDRRRPEIVELWSRRVVDAWLAWLDR